MAIMTSAWQNFIDGKTVLVDGKPWPWQYGSNDQVPVDFSDAFAVGDVIATPVATLRKIPAFSESDYTDTPGSITATTISGSAVLVRLSGLERGRFYKLDVTVTASGNSRGGNTIIEVSG